MKTPSTRFVLVVIMLATLPAAAQQTAPHTTARTTIDFPNMPYSFRVTATNWRIIRGDRSESIAMGGALESDRHGIVRTMSSAPILVRERGDRLALRLDALGYVNRQPTRPIHDELVARRVPIGAGDVRLSIVDASTGRVLEERIASLTIRVRGEAARHDSLVSRALEVDLDEWVGRSLSVRMTMIATSIVDRAPTIRVESPFEISKSELLLE